MVMLKRVIPSCIANRVLYAMLWYKYNCTWYTFLLINSTLCHLYLITRVLHCFFFPFFNVVVVPDFLLNSDIVMWSSSISILLYFEDIDRHNENDHINDKNHKWHNRCIHFCIFVFDKFHEFTFLILAQIHNAT